MPEYDNRETGAEESLTVFVNGISFEATQQDIEDFFSSCGATSEVRVDTFSDSGRCRGKAHLTFVDQDGVSAAIAKDGAEFMGREIHVEISKPRRQRNDETTVFVGNLSFDAENGDLESAFQEFGEVTSVRIPTDRDSGRKKGFGYVEFADAEAVQKAIDASGMEICGRSVRIDKAGGGRGGDRGGYGDRRGGYGDRRGGRGGYGDRRGGYGDRNGGRGYGDRSGGRSYGDRRGDREGGRGNYKRYDD